MEKWINEYRIYECICKQGYPMLEAEPVLVLTRRNTGYYLKIQHLSTYWLTSMTKES
jgi:hypothetical protein